MNLIEFDLNVNPSAMFYQEKFSEDVSQVATMHVERVHALPHIFRAFHYENKILIYQIPMEKVRQTAKSLS